MRHSRFLIIMLILLALWLAACNRQNIAPGDIPGSGPTRGEALFQLNPLGDLPGCGTCHSLKSGEQLVGPSMVGIATIAENQATGLAAEAFLRQGILKPDAYLEPGFNPGAMPRYSEGLTAQDVDDLVAYLLTLK
jgi:mono/diheme cytochrome c family protein